MSELGPDQWTSLVIFTDDPLLCTLCENPLAIRRVDRRRYLACPCCDFGYAVPVLGADGVAS